MQVTLLDVSTDDSSFGVAALRKCAYLLTVKAIDQGSPKLLEPIMNVEVSRLFDKSAHFVVKLEF